MMPIRARLAYSAKEIGLFAKFGFNLNLDGNPLPPMAMYQACMTKAFMDNLQGPHVESLRECCYALDNGSVKRMTPEWDDMIRL